MTRPVRILLISPRYPPAVGGVERVVGMLATGLAKRRLEVEVATTDPMHSATTIEAQGNLTIRRFPTIGRDDVFFLSPRLAVWLLRKAGGFDLIHAHSYHTPLALLGAIAAWLHRVPFVVTPHYHGTGHTKARQFLHRPYRRLGAWMIRRADLVVCSSEAECALLSSHFGAGRPTRVVEYGGDTDPTSQTVDGSPENGRIVLAGGRIEEYKQIEVVVRAVEHLAPDFRLVVFGDGPARDQVEAAAIETGVDGRIEFVGRVSDEDLARRFRTATVFVSMSRKEAYGLTVLEAAAAGTAVVCSDIPAYREMADRFADDAIRLLDVNAAPGAVAEAIHTAANAPRPIVPPGSTVPSWDRMVAETIEGYRTVLATHGRFHSGRPG